MHSGSMLPSDETELMLIDPAKSTLTHLTLTPWDGRECKDNLSDGNIGLDRAFLRNNVWDPAIVERLYHFTTKCNYIEDENVIAIELLSPTDTRFSFRNGSNWLSYMEQIGINEKGTTLRIIFTGIVKYTQQYKPNFVVSFVPLTRLGWCNAKGWITKYSVGAHKLCIKNDNIPMSKKIDDKDSIQNYVYDASEFYMINHTLMEKYEKDLEPGNIVVIDCGLEKYRETTWTQRDKVAFKICGISYIGEGVTPLNELATLGSSPSKKRLGWFPL